jgi:hypothetical protein
LAETVKAKITDNHTLFPMDFEKVVIDKIETNFSYPIPHNIIYGQVEMNIFKDCVSLSPNPQWIKVPQNIVLEIAVYENELNLASQCTLNFIFENQNLLNKIIEVELLKYYIDEIRPLHLEYLEDDPDNFWHNIMPELTSNDTNLVKNFNFFYGIKIPISLKGGYFAMNFTSHWQAEHGLSIYFKNYKFDSVSISDSFESDEQFIRKGIINSPLDDEYYEDLRGLNLRRLYKWNKNSYFYDIIKDIPFKELDLETQKWFKEIAE